jgi:(heptosyl)LPS beta-1,4-glucosyltransferase
VSTGDFVRQQGHGQLLCRHAFDRLMRWDADLPADLVERMWHDPHALLSESNKLQDKLRCSVAKLDHPAGPFVWKHSNWGTLARTLKRSLSQSPAEKSWNDARFLSSAGVPTPRPRAYFELRLGPFKRSSYLLLDYVAGTSLYRFMRFERPTDDFVRGLAGQVAAIWQQLDDLCLWHNDFKTENLLVDRHGKVWLIDFERMRRFHNRDRLRRRQIRDVHDFFHPRNWRQNPGAAEIFRRELLKTPAMRATLAGPNGAKHPLAKPRPKINRNTQLVTVLISGRNAADTIVACVDSVRDMADEILVADSGSIDGTLPLLQELDGCRIIQRSCDDEIDFATWAESQARHGWIFRLLPNEKLNSELGRQIQDAVAAEPREDGFRVLRNIFFRGRLLKYGGFSKSSSIRLFRKNAAQYELRDGRAEVVLQSNKVGELAARLSCELCVGIERLVSDVISNSQCMAHDGLQRGRQPTRRRALGQASWQLMQSYLLRMGWLDGWAGLHASCLSAFAIYLREAMLWELNQPAVMQRIVVRDSWQGLKLFDPAASDSVAPTFSDASSRIDEPAATPGTESQVLRPAA